MWTKTKPNTELRNKPICFHLQHAFQFLLPFPQKDKFMSLPSDFPWLRFHLPSPLSFHSCIQRKDLPTIYHPSCSQPEVKTANKRKFVTHYLMWKLLLGWGWSHDSLWLKSNTSDSGLLYFRSKTTVFLLCQLKPMLSKNILNQFMRL